MRTILQCDRCDFHVTLPLDDPGTHRYYDLGDGHIAPVETEEAWCYNCQTMRVVEVLPSRAFIDVCIDEFKESLADIDAGADAFRQQLPYVEFMRRVVTSHDAWIAWLASRISVRGRKSLYHLGVKLLTYPPFHLPSDGYYVGSIPELTRDKYHWHNLVPSGYDDPKPKTWATNTVRKRRVSQVVSGLLPG